MTKGGTCALFILIYVKIFVGFCRLPRRTSAARNDGCPLALECVAEVEEEASAGGVEVAVFCRVVGCARVVIHKIRGVK